ncbi:YugE family protein [Peribacillus frigoritolerans]|uniref:YugE family protein n=1 Tax=Peribacillus frigoritolerans TaxID=450367 RepID=UPI002226EE42|nr:YugE family protein [Peribacillus frigoritolerans]UYY98586.1 YugE family protein [Peribacillus frigoritolerans]
MDTQQMNLALVAVLQEWDPFKIGWDLYEPEIADTVVAIRDIDDPKELAEKIKSIYEFAFDESIQMEKCLDVARKLLFIKNDASCSI